MGSRKYWWDFDFFKKENPISAYWAGFIMADGSFYEDTNRLKIELSITDENILLSFCKDIKINISPIKHSSHTKDNKTTFGSYMNLMHQNLGKDLYKWGIISNKTNKFIEPSFDMNLLGYYIKGCFDGDGTINNNDQFRGIKLITNKDFLDWLSLKIDKNITNGCLYLCKKSPIIKTLCFSTLLGAKQFYDFCHGNEQPRLERKWTKIEKLLEKVAIVKLTDDKINFYEKINTSKQTLIKYYCLRCGNLCCKRQCRFKESGHFCGKFCRKIYEYTNLAI